MTRSTGDAWYEVAFGAHYPLLYSHRDGAEARRVLALLPTLAPLGPGPVLDLGCGQGRHLQALRQDGTPALGLDLSAPLLRQARRDHGPLPVMRGDMRQLPVRDGAVTAVLSLFTAFGYFGPGEAHRPVAREIGRILTRGGHWFLDFLNSRRVAAELAAGDLVRERVLGPLRIHERRRLADRPRRVVKTVRVVPEPGQEAAAADLGVTATGLDYAEEVTLLDLAEIDELAAHGGMQRVAAAGDYDGSSLQAEISDRWLLVYRHQEQEGTRG